MITVDKICSVQSSVFTHVILSSLELKLGLLAHVIASVEPHVFINDYHVCKYATASCSRIINRFFFFKTGSGGVLTVWCAP